MLTLPALAILLLALSCNTLGSVLFKRQASLSPTIPDHHAAAGVTLHALRHALGLLAHRQIWLGIGLQLVALLAWLAFLSRVDLGVAFSLSSISNVSVLLACSLILHERVGVRRWCGALVIMAGIALIAQGARP